MPSQITVLVGPARCGKTHRLVDQYRRVLQPAGAEVGRAIWLAPTTRAVAAIREALVGGPGLTACLDPGVTTFDALAHRIGASLPTPPRAISAFQQRVLVRRVVEDAKTAKRLQHLSAMFRHGSFIDLLCAHFAELKRYGVSPAAFARSAGPRGDRRQQEELADLFSRYEDLLSTHRLADEEGLQIAAGNALQTDATLLPHLQLVVVDGFTDFTHPQLELLSQLAGRARQLCITLPGEVRRSTGRDELFAKTSDTLAELRLHLPKLDVEQVTCRATDWPALDHIAEHLFEHPRDVPVPSPAVQDSLDRFEIVAAAGVQDEIVELARQVKRKLTNVTAPLPPGDVVVVFRSLHEAAPRIRTVFDEFGIPYSLEAGRPLASTTVVRLLLDLLRLDADDWPYRRVVSICANHQLGIADRPTRAAAEWLVRELQVDRGRRSLLERVAVLAAAAAENGSSDEPRAHTHHDRRSLVASTALPLLTKLAAALDTLPEVAIPLEWIVALVEFATTLQLKCFSETLREPEDVATWRAIGERLSELELLAAWQKQPVPRLSRAELLDMLVDVARHESLPREADDTGRVRILSAQTARTVAAREVFLAGMSEQAFPSPERAGSFYSAADYRFFAAAADQERAAAALAPLARSQEEMLLFYEVLTRASERLTISYPALDEKAQSLPPSPYVTEVERAVSPATIKHDRATRPAPIPVGDLPLGPRDWRVQAVHEALDGDRALLAGMFRTREPAGASLESALRIISARGRRDAFGPAEGLLESEGVRVRLARRFGSEHLWSPSQWETYAGCPYRFFLEQVLRLEPLGELVLETDHLRRGSLVHRALAEFHRRAVELLGSDAPLSQHDRTKFISEFENLVEALVRATPYTGVEAALVELDRLQIAKWAPRYHNEHAKYDANWSLDRPLAPTYLEWRFGPPRTGEQEFEDPRSTNDPFQLQIGKEKIRITGRIDRIDVGAAGDNTLFSVLDYKSGKRPTLSHERVISGERLQPALYVMAAQALLFGNDAATPLYAGYWSLTNGITVAPAYSLHLSDDLQSESEKWVELRNSVVELLRGFVRDIRHGDFPVASRDEHCTSRCDFATVCRIAQVRSLGKQWFLEEDATPLQRPEGRK
ncbi:MAG: PD-(D/E)XK nuclease family protein [Pirellulales bacterium]